MFNQYILFKDVTNCTVYNEKNLAYEYDFKSKSEIK